MSSRYGVRGARQGVNSKSGPVWRGTQYFSGMPFPLNHSTNRDSMAREPALPGAAYAVPDPLNMPARGGKPTRTMAPAKLPQRKSLRDNAIDASVPGTGYRHYKLPKAELRTPEPLIRLLDGRLVLRLLGPPVGVPEQLFHDALLVHRL